MTNEHDDEPGDLFTAMEAMSTGELEAMRDADHESEENKAISEILDRRWRKNRSIVMTVVIDGYFEEDKLPSVRLQKPIGEYGHVTNPNIPDLFSCWEIIRKMMELTPEKISWCNQSFKGQESTEIYSIGAKAHSRSIVQGHAPDGADQPTPQE